MNGIDYLLASDQFWSTVVRAFGSTIKRIAFEGAIKNDDFRSPTTRLILGNDPWIHLIEARGISTDKSSSPIVIHQYATGKREGRFRMMK
jgi:hypothetical protein